MDVFGSLFGYVWYIISCPGGGQQVARAPKGLSTEKLAERWPNLSVISGPFNSQDDAYACVDVSARQYRAEQQTKYVSRLSDGGKF